MCRSIKQLREGSTPATGDDVRRAALQFVRKISGFRTPAPHNEEVFNRAVEEIASSSRTLLSSLVIGRRDSGSGTG